ncbi:MAG: hypothetical protein ACXW2C_03375 [Acidimicrobiia bacterium]
MGADDTESLPRVTAGLLRGADTMCTRRLHREHQGTRGNRRADSRFRVANQLLDDARLAHVDLAPPTPGYFRPATDLLPEQQRVYELAARWYVQLFAEDAVRSVEVEFETAAESLGIRLVGPAGLPVEHASGERELRILRLGQGPVPTEPLATPEIRFAILRLESWLSGGLLRLVVADLIRGEMVEQRVVVDDELAELGAWLADRVEQIRARTFEPRAVKGIECGWCPFIAGCGAHAVR